MEWYQVATIAASNVLAFLWVVRQSRTDFHQTLRMIQSIQDEMKEFHGRLCTIEERNKR